MAAEDISITTARRATTDIKNNITVKGRLKSCFNFWENVLLSSRFVLSVIRNGYALPLIRTPPPFFATNNRSSLRHTDFVENEIEEYLAKSYIREIETAAYCCNPLTVAEGKKLRLVLDLRHVNQYLRMDHFRYEDLKTVSNLLNTGDYFTSFDLVSGYHHIEINHEYYELLGFQWLFKNGIIRNFQFLVLVFGLSTACYVFTKITRPLIKRWRLKGYKVLIYLDDGFNIGSDYNTCKASTEHIIQDLESSGFVINHEKSNLEPRQIGQWLGTVIDTNSMLFYVPPEKITDLKRQISQIESHNKITPRLLSKIAGRLSSMHMSLGPIVRLMTRNMYIDIQKDIGWDTPFHPSKASFDELFFWHTNIDARNGYAIKPNPPTSQILFTDASGSAYGGYILKRLGKIVCHGTFTQDQQEKSSTERELLAIKHCLQSFAHEIRHEAVDIRTDNFAASRIVEIGSSKPHLQKLAIEIFEVCIKNDIRIFPKWIPRDLNQYADYLSKFKDTDDWSIDKGTFARICNLFGYPTVDRFADDKNTQVKVFNSKFYCPGTNAVNAFTQDWKDSYLNWLAPPISLIPATIRHVRFCKARGILLVPVWPSSQFWPILHNGTSFEKFVKEYCIVNPYYSSKCEESIFKGFTTFKTIALLIEF